MVLAIPVLAVGACRKDAPPPPAQLTARAAAPTVDSAVVTESRAGFDSVVTRQLAGGTCYLGSRYVVAAKDHEVGSDLFVRPRAPADTASQCQTDSLPGDAVFRSGDAAGRHPDAQNFLGLKGDLLLAWDGTGAASDLYVYDLRKRAKVLEVDGIDEDHIEWPDPSSLTLWVTTAYDKKAAAAGCPDTLPANPPQLDSLTRLRFPGLELRRTGRFRCTVGQ